MEILSQETDPDDVKGKNLHASMSINLKQILNLLTNKQ